MTQPDSLGEASFSFYPLFVIAGQRAKSLMLSRWGAIATGAFLLGLIGLPFFDQLDKSEGLPRLLPPVIVLALLLPPAAVIFLAYRGVRWFIHETGVAIKRAASDPSNVLSRRAARFFEILVSGGRVTRNAAQAGGAGLAVAGYMAVSLAAFLLALAVSLFVVGGIIGLLVIGWNAL